MAAGREQSRIPRAIAVGIGTVLLTMVVVAAPFWQFLVYPVNILLSSDAQSVGTEIYVDGRRVLTVNGKGDVLHFRRGWHVVEARKPGFRTATARFKAEDSEQASTTTFCLRTQRSKGRTGLRLTVE
jgi:hypothetical protein